MARQHEQLQADRREAFGKKVRQLRRDGLLPGNVYGLDMKPIPLTLEGRRFIAVHQRVGSTGVIDLAVDGADSLPVLVQEVQHDPPTSRVLHVSFLQVDLTKSINAMVPVTVFGESPALEQGAIIIQHVNEVEVAALPDDIPESFEVDVTVLTDIDHGLVVGDLRAPEGVTIQTDPEDLLVRAERPRVIEEETPAEDEELEGEEGEGEEGEEGAAEEATEE